MELRDLKGRSALPPLDETLRIIRFFPPDPLTISDLFHVNESLTSIEHVWKEFGAALGLKQATLEKIRSRYLQQIDCCFTEVLAAKKTDLTFHLAILTGKK